MMFDLVIERAVARLRLDRPEARNAIPQASWRALGEALDKVLAAEARVLLVGSTSASQFCAGADLRDLERLPGDSEGQKAMRTGMRTALDALATLPIPTIALIDGGCFGAGVALALACDIRVATRAASFAIPPAKLGISYPHEDVARLVALIGWGRAAHLLFTGARIGGEEAARIGLVELLADDIDRTADDLAAAILAGAPSSHALLKRSIALARQGETSSVELDRAFEAAFDGADFAEGIAAMRERRTPEFKR